MTRAVVKQILDAVDALQADDAAKAEFRSAVRRVCVAHGFQWVALDDRLNFAQELLLRKVSRSTIRDRLIALYGISRCQSYRTIDAALKKLSQKAATK
ncbi:MAG: hypothetical protein JWL97_4323 [Gemmatimonadales bacterium]|nr:hypothetical protein [Gemmatimonadales bacterium]